MRKYIRNRRERWKEIVGSEYSFMYFERKGKRKNEGRERRK
jgi:hypothetical protein